MQALLDGALGREDRRVFEEHVAGCAACREAHADLRRLAGLLAAWPRIAPSPGLAARVLAAVRPAAPALLPIPARVLAGLAVIALAATGILLAPGTRDAFARLLAAGTERGASDAVALARAIAAVLTALVPLLEQASAVLAALLATGKGFLIAVGHLSAGPLGFAALLTLTLALAAGVLFRHLVHPRERRGLHVLVF
jgi:anti-sigma factor RsiW